MWTRATTWRSLKKLEVWRSLRKDLTWKSELVLQGPVRVEACLLVAVVVVVFQALKLLLFWLLPRQQRWRRAICRPWRNVWNITRTTEPSARNTSSFSKLFARHRHLLLPRIIMRSHRSPSNSRSNPLIEYIVYEVRIPLLVRRFRL